MSGHSDQDLNGTTFAGLAELLVRLGLKGSAVALTAFLLGSALVLEVVPDDGLRLPATIVFFVAWFLLLRKLLRGRPAPKTRGPDVPYGF